MTENFDYLVQDSIVMREVGPTPSAQVMKALLNLGPEVEQMLALTRLRLKR
jgi:hypothetical protein